MTTPVDYYNEEPIQLDDDDIQRVPTRHTEESTYSRQSSRRSVSASDLLRKSSAFLKSKFDSLKKTPTREQDPSISASSPTKLIMKTTISIPSTARSASNPVSPPSASSPALTQYPPKPLVYSPIEPIPVSTSKPLLHRLSMPLLKVYNDSTLSRHRSITSFGRRRKSEPDHHSKRKARKSTTRQN